MAELIELLRHLRVSGVFCAMVYLQEAHADDIWPLGYGIKKHSSLEGRIEACQAFLSKHQALREALDYVVVDAMDDSFLHTYGAWPERYFFASREGVIEWASTTGSRERQPSICEQVRDHFALARL